MARGYFVVADITGYTMFLAKSELEHAQDILNALFQEQLKFFTPPLVVNGFRGDAILAYVLEKTFVQGQTLLETLESVYYAFTGLREKMRQNTTCTCKACSNIPALDLKFFVHFGSFMLQKLGDRDELLGPDVIVVFRMMKNRVKEDTGVKAYALLTEAALAALNLGPISASMAPYSESYEHIGEVKMRVHDLGTSFERWREGRRLRITADGAHASFAVDLPVPPPLAWDYITKTDLKRRWLQMESVTRIDDLGGRVQVGAQFHCAHSAGDIRYAIVDWRPFSYFTVEAVGFLDGKYTATYQLDPAREGSRFEVSFVFDAEKRAQVEPLYRAALSEDVRLLRSIVEADLADGKIALSPA